MTVPIWALSLAFWLHMLATVVWIGGLATIALLVLPAARRALAPPEYAALLGQIQRRFDPLGWFSLVVLAGTGMVQMSANSNYQGFLAIDNAWATAILIKHVLFLGMAGISALLTWGIMPQLHRLALRQARQSGAPVDAVLQSHLLRREHRLLNLNLFLGVLVLALTAFARAA